MKLPCIISGVKQLCLTLVFDFERNKMSGDLLEKKIEIIRLFDTYSLLLTKKQREVMELYLEDDLSYSEIAESLQISKQAVHDKICNAIKNLQKYENGVGFVDYCLRQETEILDIHDNIGNMEARELKQRLAALLGSENREAIERN